MITKSGISRAFIRIAKISDHQQGWGYEDGLWKGPGHLCWWPLSYISGIIRWCQFESDS